MRTRLQVAISLALALGACQLVVDEEALVWNGGADAGEASDAGAADAGEATDAGEAVDAGEATDAGAADAGQTADAGNCGVCKQGTICDPASGLCVECLLDEQCDANQVCHAAGIPFACGLPWVEVGAAGSEILNAVWAGADGVAWAVGDAATILRCTKSGCTQKVVSGLGTSVQLKAVVGDDQGVVFAVGSGGTVVRCEQECSLFDSSPGITLTAAAIAQETLWTTTATGKVQYRDPEAWKQAYSSTDALYALWSSGEAVLAAGTNGKVVSCMASSATAPSCTDATVLGSSDRHVGVAGAGSLRWLATQVSGTGALRRSDDGGANWSSPTTFGWTPSAVTSCGGAEPRAWLTSSDEIFRVRADLSLQLEMEAVQGFSLLGVSASSDGRHVWAVGKKTTTSTGLVLVR